MRILGLDYGDKTVGVAVSDPFGWTAQGVEIIRRANPNEYKQSIGRINELIEEYGVEKIWIILKALDAKKQGHIKNV